MSVKSSRLSVRGAFGPSGSLFKGGGRRASALPSRAQLFQLDKCLDKKALDKVIYQMSSSADTIKKSKMQSLDRGQKSTFSYDVEGFADFLSANKALATLLFWKDAEEYSTLFGSDERKNTAEKICKRCIRSHPLPQWP